MTPLEGDFLFAELVVLSAAGLGLAAIAASLHRRIPTVSRLLWSLVCADGGLAVAGCVLFPSLGPRWGVISSVAVLAIVSTLIATTRRLLLILGMALSLGTGMYLGLQQWMHLSVSEAELNAAIDTVGAPKGFRESQSHADRIESFSGITGVTRYYAGAPVPSPEEYTNRLHNAGFADIEKGHGSGGRSVVVAGSSWWRRVVIVEQADNPGGQVLVSAIPLGVADTASQDLDGRPKSEPADWRRLVVTVTVIALILADSWIADRPRTPHDSVG